MPKNLWILTEERPKKESIACILCKFSTDNKIACFIDTIRILPLLNDKSFSFRYEVIGFQCQSINKIYIEIVSGSSSFVDFLLFYQEERPTEKDQPIYAIEETKTSDSESRNTGVYQRATKFVYIDFFYENLKKIILYSSDSNRSLTDTYKFGMRCLKTLKVDVINGLSSDNIIPFKNIDELIKLKSLMGKPPPGNTPIEIKKTNNTIKISGKLFKQNGLNHDPNIGALSLICATLRELNWIGKLVITKHGLEQKHIEKNNKFIKISKELDIEFEHLNKKKTSDKEEYWHYEKKGEKLGTIFIHLVVENFTSGKSIYENHAGCERGYFITSDGKPIQIKKYTDKEEYKKGDKEKIISLPDLILIDIEKVEIINIEGKKYTNKEQGIKDLNKFDAIEEHYIKPNYSEYSIIRTVVLYGSKKDKIIEIEIGFLLNENGKLILGKKPPDIFKRAIENLVEYWKDDKL